MGLRQQIARVREARARLAASRAKLEKLDAEQQRIAKATEGGREEPADRPRRRRRFNID